MAPAVGWRERVGSDGYEGDFETVPECVTRPIGDMQGLRGSGKRLRLLVPPTGDTIRCGEAVASIDGAVMFRDQNAMPVAKVGV